MLAPALVCTLIAALGNWSTRVRPNVRLETISKPLTTILVIWVAIAADGPRAATILAVIGLVCCLAGDIGATFGGEPTSEGVPREVLDALLFGERPGGFIVSGSEEALERLAEKIPLDIFGEVGGDRLDVVVADEEFSVSMDELRAVHDGGLRPFFP